LSGAYKWGKRDRKVSSNPVDRFELPKSVQSRKPSKTPELGDLLRLLSGADEHDPCLAPVLKLGATTGMRRGELAGLRRDRLRLNGRELVVDTAVNDAGGVIVEKRTKTQRDRVVSIDDATVAMLRTHLADMDHRARLCGTTVSANAFVFSLDPGCRVPMRPEFMTRRMRVLRAKLSIDAGDFDATILALRKWTSSELMDAGFNPSAVSDRQGHTVQTMLHHYSSRRRSADRAAADHLGTQVHGRSSQSPATEGTSGQTSSEYNP
jgi:integrase